MNSGEKIWRKLQVKTLDLKYFERIFE